MTPKLPLIRRSPDISNSYLILPSHPVEESGPLINYSVAWGTLREIGVYEVLPLEEYL